MKVQIKFSQGKRWLGQSLEKFLAQSFQLSSPSRVTNDTNFPGNHMWHYVQSIVIEGISTNSWYPEVFFWPQSHRPGWPPNVADLSFQSPWRLSWYCWPKIPPEVTVLDYLYGPNAPGKQRCSYKAWLFKSLVLPPRSQGQSKASFWARLNFLLYI